MDVGFTGTQKGMTVQQRIVFRKIIESLIKKKGEIIFHHGDCIGADEEAHEIVRSFLCLVHLHPPNNNSKRAFCNAQVYENPKEYLDRNMDIVLSSELLIATPKNFKEKIRSGTWSTVRRARAKGLKTIIIYPDGSLDKSW